MGVIRMMKLGAMALGMLAALPALADPREDVPVVHAAGSGDLEARVGRLENLVQSNGLLDLLSQVEKLQEEVRQLRGQVETQSHQMDELDAKQAKLYDDLERRLQALDHGGAPAIAAAMPPPANPPLPTVPAAASPVPNQAAGGQGLNPPAQNSAVADNAGGDATAPNTAPAATAAGGGQPSNQPVPSATPPNPTGSPGGGTNVAALAPAGGTANTSGNPDQDYKQALELLKRNRYDEAIAVLNNFLVSYPTHPNAESAEYWLGEAYYVSKQYPAAISEFQKFVQAYPKSTKLSQVLLKTGFSYHEMGQIDQAKSTLEDVKQRFPGTTAANMADQRLQRIRMEQKP
ncbi:MAG TPA: tol-pal system protein YbgF [Gammaproteobacteria bacterium]|nr:tol-pal system protein YbgF [Gammaproteobacteria bacterium]